MITSGVFSAKVSVPGATVLRTRGATKSVSSKMSANATLALLQRPTLTQIHYSHTVRCLGWRLQEPRACGGKGQGAENGATEGHCCSLTDYKSRPAQTFERKRCTGLLAGANGRHKAGFSASVPSQVATEGSGDFKQCHNGLQSLIPGASKAEYPTAVVAVTLCLMKARARCQEFLAMPSDRWKVIHKGQVSDHELAQNGIVMLRLL